MQELVKRRTRNSKTYLIETLSDGRQRFAVDYAIGSQHYKDRQGKWQDIVAELEDDVEGWTKTGRTPYLLKLDKEANRRIYLDRNNPSKYIELGTGIPKGILKAFTRRQRDCRWDTGDLAVELRVEPTRVKFLYILKNASAPTMLRIPLQLVGFDWPLENLLQPFIETGFEERRFCEWDYKDGELTILVDTTGLDFPIVVDPTVDEQVGASADDVNVFESLTAHPPWDSLGSLAFASVNMGLSGSTYLGCGLRFQTVAVAKGSTIDVAYLTFNPNAGSSGTTVNLIIHGELGDAVQFSDIADFNGRARTTNSVAWSNVGAWVEDTPENSPSIVSIVDEIINNTWVSGYDMALFVEDNEGSNSSDTRGADSYDGSSGDAPKLHVEYTAAVPVTVTPGTLALTDTHYAPIIKHKIIVPVLALSDTEYAPVIKLGIIPSTLALSDTEYAPIIKLGIIPPVLALSDTEYAPIIKLKVIPPTLALSDTEYAPVIGLKIIPPVLALTLTTYAPVIGLKVIPPTLALSDTEYAPTITVGVYATPPTLALSLTTFAATIATPQVFTPSTLALILTAYIPTAAIPTAAILATPGLLELVLAPYTACVGWTETQNLRMPVSRMDESRMPVSRMPVERRQRRGCP